MARALTGKQSRFCEEYVIDFNATQAAIRAGYSKKTADQIGSELLRKTLVSKDIKRLTGNLTQRSRITVDKLVQGILEVIEDARATIYDSDGNKSMTDRMGALKGYDMLGKHLGMFDGNGDTAKDQQPAINIHMYKD